jgi:hypothetical protein
MGPYEEFPLFFGHLNIAFFENPPLSGTRRVQFCSHAYGILTLSPGSSQLPPEELGDIFANRILQYVDPAVFSSTSFPSWFAFETATRENSTNDIEVSRDKSLNGCV